MHLPEGILPLEQSIVYWGISLMFVAVFLYKFSKNEDKERGIILIALFSVFFIVVTSLSVPSPLGVPIHFFLIPLVAIMLGPFRAYMVAFFGLLIQFFVLNMGGIVCFGANFLVIGVIIAFMTFAFYNIFRHINESLAIFLSTVIGIMSATFGQVFILILSGAMNLDSLLATLVPFYMFISLIEGFANVIIINAIKKIKPEMVELSKNGC